MRLLFIFLLSLVISSAFSQSIDTLINADINPDRKMERISFTYPGYQGYEFILRIDDETYTGNFIMGDDAFITILDLDKSDGYLEVSVVEIGPSDQTISYLFRFNGKIIKLGEIGGMWTDNPDGSGIFYVGEWMGFWMKNQKYRLDNEFNKIVTIDEETYKVDIEAEVISPFELYVNKSVGSSVVAKLSPATKIRLIQADVRPQCINSAGYMDEDECDWYLIKSENGFQGWIQLKDFRDKIEGLIWAG